MPVLATTRQDRALVYVIEETPSRCRSDDAKSHRYSTADALDQFVDGLTTLRKLKNLGRASVLIEVSLSDRQQLDDLEGRARIGLESPYIQLNATTYRLAATDTID